MLSDGERCRRCGTSEWEWLDDDGKRIAPAPYVAEGYKCFGCAEKEKVEEEREKEYRRVKASRHGDRVGLFRLKIEDE